MLRSLLNFITVEMRKTKRYAQIEWFFSQLKWGRVEDFTTNLL